MKKIDKIGASVIKDLFQSSDGSLENFTLYKRLKTNLSGITQALNYLVDEGLVEISTLRTKLTDKGKEWALSGEAKALFSEKHVWKDIPEKFIGEQIKPNSFYIPSRRMLDRELK